VVACCGCWMGLGVGVLIFGEFWEWVGRSWPCGVLVDSRFGSGWLIGFVIVVGGWRCLDGVSETMGRGCGVREVLR